MYIHTHWHPPNNAAVLGTHGGAGGRPFGSPDGEPDLFGLNSRSYLGADCHDGPAVVSKPNAAIGARPCMTTRAASMPITEPAGAVPGPQASNLCSTILLRHERTTCSRLMLLVRPSKDSTRLNRRRIHERSFVAPAFTVIHRSRIYCCNNQSGPRCSSLAALKQRTRTGVCHSGIHAAIA
jgi:hypothetical protein